MVLLASCSTESGGYWLGWGAEGGKSDLFSELLEPEPSVLREANQLSPYVSYVVTRLPRGGLKVNWEAAAKKQL